MMEKVYHIYAKRECLYNNLTEQQFNNTWETLKGMVGLMKTDYELEDLDYILHVIIDLKVNSTYG